MSKDNLNTNRTHHEVDLRELFTVMWSEKFKILTITVFFAIGSVIYSLLIPNQYKAVAVLAPAQSDGGGLSSALGQLGGLASLAGVSIDTVQISESKIAQQIMKSWSFIETFIIDNDLSVKIFAVNGWSMNSDELHIDEDIYDSSRGEWILEDPAGKRGPPTSWQLFDRFSNMLSISENKLTGLVSVSITYYSPALAKQWVDSFVSAINEHMQERQVIKVTNNIRYLEEQIEKTSIAEMREVFYTIIEEQTKNKMVAEASPDYTFVTVSPSMVPEQKSQPMRAIICILGTLFGGLLSVIVVLTSHYVKSYRVSREN